MTKNIGEILQHARKDKGLSLQSISNQLFIRVHYLEAIEDNDFYLIPSNAQLIGFIRAYAVHLDLDSEELIESLTEKSTDDAETTEIVSPDPDPNTANKLKSLQIYIEIGNHLRQNREKLGISLNDVASYIHINPARLDAVEKGELDQFSSAAQARGMLRNYSDFLGLETDRLLVRFAEALQTKIGVQTEKIVEVETIEDDEALENKHVFRLREILSLDMAVFGIVAILIILFLFWGVGRVMRIQSEIEPEITQTEVAESNQTPEADIFLGLDNDPDPDDIAVEFQEANEITNDAIPTIQVISGDSITMNVIATIRTYLKIVVDGEVKFDGRVLSGSNLAFTGQDNIEIITGNGAAIELIFNGSSIGKMGSFGHDVHNIYTKEGQFVPTPAPQIETDELDITE